MAAQQPSNPWRYFHLGLELAAATVVLGLIGFWVDYLLGTAPWGLLVGVLVGATGGMYLFIKDALRAVGQHSHDRLSERRRPPGSVRDEQGTEEPESDTREHKSDGNSNGP